MKVGLKRGDSSQIVAWLPVEVVPRGSMVYFMAKAAIDDDPHDTQAHLSLTAVEGDEADGKLRWTFTVSPADTDGISMNGEESITLKGEIEVRRADGAVYSFPQGKKMIDVIIYGDIRRGGNG